MVEEVEDKEVLYSCKIVVINIDFQGRSIQVTQDNQATSHTFISVYHQTDDRAMVIIEVQGLDW